MKIMALKIKDKLDDYTSQYLLSIIDKEKRERLVKFVFWQDMHRSLFADLMIRKLIMDNFNIDNKKIEFKVNKYGKPYYNSLEDFHFNVSHAGNWVVCVADNKPVGIDIEKKADIDLGISENYFSEKEHNDLVLKNDPVDYFFTLWSLKESYIKFIGKGLSHPLNTFSIGFDRDENIYMESYGQKMENLKFKQYHMEEGYKMAVCSLNHNFPEKYQMVRVDNLVATFITSSTLYVNKEI